MCAVKFAGDRLLWTLRRPATALGHCPSCRTRQTEAEPVLNKRTNRTVFLCPCGRWYTFAEDGA